MSIALVCSHGGHLTQILLLMKAFKKFRIFFVTYNNPRTKALPYKKYLLENIGTNPKRMLVAFFKILHIFLKEKPWCVISTGAEIAIPAFIIAKFLRIHTIFIESWSRVKSPSKTGKIVCLLSDLFLVQWPQLLNKYIKQPKYVGAII